MRPGKLTDAPSARTGAIVLISTSTCLDLCAGGNYDSSQHLRRNHPHGGVRGVEAEWGKDPMRKKTAEIPYRKPTITTYGSVRELTLGNGSSPLLDSQSPSCGPLAGKPRGTTPSQVTCVPG